MCLSFHHTGWYMLYKPEINTLKGTATVNTVLARVATQMSVSVEIGRVGWGVIDM